MYVNAKRGEEKDGHQTADTYNLLGSRVWGGRGNHKR